MKAWAGAVVAGLGMLAWQVSAVRAAPLPPDLAALEQQMAQLHVDSERFNLQEDLSLRLPTERGAIPFILIVAGEGEASDSPPQLSLTAGLFGMPSERVRVIGDTEYRYRHEAAEMDGGRPWVRGAKAGKEGKEGLPGLGASGLLDGDQPGAQGTFSKLVETLNGAQAIEESGPVTVDDQRVTEFDAKLDPTLLLAKLQRQTSKQRHPLRSLFETTPVGREHGPAEPPALELEVFIAPNGLPVRTRLTFTAEGLTVDSRIDTLATNVPVHVVPPPPSETIGEAQLKRIERRIERERQARFVRLCRSLHGRRIRLLCHPSRPPLPPHPPVSPPRRRTRHGRK